MARISEVYGVIGKIVNVSSVAACAVVLFCMTLGGYAQPAEAKETIYLTIAGTAIGKAQYAMAAALADVINKKLPGVKATAGTTTGTYDRLRKMNKGRIEMAWTEPLAGYAMYTKTGRFAGLKGPNILALAGGVLSMMQVFTLEDSDIKTPQDFRGKRIGLGLPGSTAFVLSKEWLDVHGINIEEVTRREINLDEQVAAMKDGHLDVVMTQTSVGASAIIDIATARGIRFIPVEDDAMKKLLEKYPPYVDTQIPANSYKGQTEPVRALGYRVSVIVRDDLDEQLAYEITKIIFENEKTLAAAHQGWAETTFANALFGVAIPLHPGAMRYYRERNHPDLDPFMERMRKQKLIH